MKKFFAIVKTTTIIIIVSVVVIIAVLAGILYNVFSPNGLVAKTKCDGPDILRGIKKSEILGMTVEKIYEKYDFEAEFMLYDDDGNIRCGYIMVPNEYFQYSTIVGEWQRGTLFVRVTFDDDIAIRMDAVSRHGNKFIVDNVPYDDVNTVYVPS